MNSSISEPIFRYPLIHKVFPSDRVNIIAIISVRVSVAVDFVRAKFYPHNILGRGELCILQNKKITQLLLFYDKSKKKKKSFECVFVYGR